MAALNSVGVRIAALPPHITDVIIVIVADAAATAGRRAICRHYCFTMPSYAYAMPLITATLRCLHIAAAAVAEDYAGCRYALAAGATRLPRYNAIRGDAIVIAAIIMLITLLRYVTLPLRH